MCCEHPNKKEGAEQGKLDEEEKQTIKFLSVTVLRGDKVLDVDLCKKFILHFLGYDIKSAESQFVGGAVNRRSSSSAFFRAQCRRSFVVSVLIR